MLTLVDGASYYKWSWGVRLRGNVDVLEAWASDNHLQDEASQQLVKLNCLVDLLATPKLQLQQVLLGQNLCRNMCEPGQKSHISFHTDLTPCLG